MSDVPTTRPSLLLRMRDAKDHEAWHTFVELYAPLVYRFARKRGLQDADAADLTQDVLRSVAGAMKDGKYDPANIEKLTGVTVEDVSRPPQPQEAIYKDRGRWTSVFPSRSAMVNSPSPG